MDRSTVYYVVTTHILDLIQSVKFHHDVSSSNTDRGRRQSTAVACVGALVEESGLQLLFFCAIHTISFFVLVVLKPFANT